MLLTLLTIGRSGTPSLCTFGGAVELGYSTVLALPEASLKVLEFPISEAFLCSVVADELPHCTGCFHLALLGFRC